MPPRAWGRRAKQPCQTQRKVPKHSLEPRGPRRALLGATGGGGGGGLRGDRAGSRRGGEPRAWLPGAGRAPGRRGAAPHPCAAGLGAWGAGGRASRDTALGARLAPSARAVPPKAKRKPPGSSGAPRPARAPGACGLRRETCALVTGTRAVGARSGGSFCATWKV